MTLTVQKQGENVVITAAYGPPEDTIENRRIIVTKEQARSLALTLNRLAE